MLLQMSVNVAVMCIMLLQMSVNVAVMCIMLLQMSRVCRQVRSCSSGHRPVSPGDNSVISVAVAMGSAGWAKSSRPPSSRQKKIINNFPVTAFIYLCGRLVQVGEKF